MLVVRRALAAVCRVVSWRHPGVAVRPRWAAEAAARPPTGVAARDPEATPPLVLLLLLLLAEEAKKVRHHLPCAEALQASSSALRQMEEAAVHPARVQSCD